VICLVAILGAAGAFVFAQLRSPGYSPRGKDAKSVRVVLKPNESVRHAGEILWVRGVIRNTRVFTVVARVLGLLAARQDRSIKPGRYTFPVGISEYRALKIIGRGGEKDAFVTVPEGFTIEQIATRLEAEEVCDREAFLAAGRDTALLRSLNIPANSAEGYLFPDSYLLPFGIAPEEVMRIMNRRFRTVFRSTWDSVRSERGHHQFSGLLAARRKPVASPMTMDQIVTLASIVEKEAEKDTERPLVASVFVNRLRRRMPLQSCATVQYVLPQRKAILSEADTRVESPYNTYLHPGLPPGPICNPGKPSLQAAISPAETNFLFFVVRGDGYHHFSASFAEHLAARKSYRQR
jgi:UPF0755 protein